MELNTKVNLLVALVIVLTVLAVWSAVASSVAAATAEHLKAVSPPNFIPGPSFAHVRDDSYDTRGSTEGGGVQIAAEHLVPGNHSWPSPTESLPRRVDYAKSPCDVANAARAEGEAMGLSGNALNKHVSNRVMGLGYQNSLRGHNAGSKLGTNISSGYTSHYNTVEGNSYKNQSNAAASKVGGEHLAASWNKNSLERLSSTKAGNGEEAYMPYEHANNRKSVYDPMRNRFAGNTGDRDRMSNVYSPEHLADGRGLEDVLAGM